MKRVFPLLMAACVLPVFCFADLHDPNNSADYMIVTTQELIDTYPWINQLAEWRTNHGRTAMVVATDSIWAEFGAGTPSDTVLKDFLHYARQNWQPPQLKDVFIIGMHDVVPSHIVPDTLSGGTPLHYISDLFFATDPDSDNHIPVFGIGRLPWSPSSSSELWNYYAKVVGYESAVDEEWQSRVHIIADYTDESFNFWQGFAEPLATEIQLGYTVERDYVDFLVGDPWHGDREEMLDNLDAGSYLFNFFGYAGGSIWSPGLVLTNETFDSLSNGHRLPIVSHLGGYDTRWNGPFNELFPIATSFLSNPDGGAIAYFGITNLGWAFAGLEFRRIMTRLATSDSVQVLGDIWRITEDEFARAHPNDYNGLGMAVPQTAYGTMLFGDPGLVLPPRPTAADEIAEELPQSIRLIGNYPNPFNASTTIRFELDRATNVSLKVYDVTGREAITLVNENRIAGSYSVTWDAQSVASGVYFAVLQAGDVRQTMKMMLLR